MSSELQIRLKKERSKAIPLPKIYLQTVLTAFCMLLFLSCGSDEEGGTEPPTLPEITTISPNRGPVGITVTLGGSGFSPIPTENRVTFNGMEAVVNVATPSSLEAVVPNSATTGPVAVTVAGKKSKGPVFTVEDQMPGIISLQPDSGLVGTEVTILGKNFGETPAENTITFNGTIAPVISASDTLLVTEVPDAATTGQVEVTVDGVTTSGPVFTVITHGDLQVIVSTSGSDPDPDGYTVLFNGGTDNRSVAVDDTVYFDDIEEGTHGLELADIAANCSVSGSNPRLVAITAGDTTSTTFSVNCPVILNNKIVFSSDRDGNEEIYVMDNTGANQTRLTNDVAVDEDPAISPDGTQIVFSSDRDGNAEIFIMDADGSNISQVTSTSGVINSTPDWSPDGTQLAFTRFTGSQEYEIFIIDTDGTDETNVTNNSGSNDLGPDWSPDGSQLAFFSDRGAEGDIEIWLINPDGSGLTQRTNTDDTISDGYPDWSPDGTQIAFSTNRDQDYEIYIMSADGTNPTRLTTTSGQDIHPSWSPDGSRVIFFSDRDGNGEIYRLNTDGTGLTNLTVNTANDIDPDWSPVE